MDVAEKRNRLWKSYREFKSCKSKLVHHDYLEAMFHAQAIEDSKHKWQEIHIYPCDYCDGIHIGRSGPPKHLIKLSRGIRKLNKIMAGAGFQAKASVETKERMLDLRAKLIVELREYERELELFQNADLEGNDEIKGALHGSHAVQSQP